MPGDIDDKLRSKTTGHSRIPSQSASKPNGHSDTSHASITNTPLFGEPLALEDPLSASVLSKKRPSGIVTGPPPTSSNKRNTAGSGIRQRRQSSISQDGSRPQVVGSTSSLPTSPTRSSAVDERFQPTAFALPPSTSSAATVFDIARASLDSNTAREQLARQRKDAEDTRIAETMSSEPPSGSSSRLLSARSSYAQMNLSIPAATLPTDPNNLLPLSVPPSPQPTPPASLRASPFHSPSPSQKLVLSGHLSDTSTGTGGYVSAGRYHDASPRTSSDANTGSRRLRQQAMSVDVSGLVDSRRQRELESDETELDEEALLTATPHAGSSQVGASGGFWDWRWANHRERDDTGAASAISPSVPSTAATSWPDTNADGSPIHLVSSELTRSRRKWRQWLAWARRKTGLGGFNLQAGSDRSPVADARHTSGRMGPIRLSRSDSGSSSGVKRKSKRRIEHGRHSSARYTQIAGRRKGGFLANGFGLDLGIGDAEWLNLVGSVIPVQPWSILLVLSLFASFAVGLTLGLIHLLNPDKEPLPWREYCQADYPRYFQLQPPMKGHAGGLASPGTSQHPSEEPLDPYSTLPAISPDYLLPLNHSSPHWPFGAHLEPPYSAEDESVDDVAPVGIFLGIFTTDAGMDRRNMIRQTYGTHWRSRVNGTEGVRMRFVMGQPRAKFERLVKLEMEAFDDILLLDMPENMNSGKTHAFLSWAAANATVPDFKWVAPQHSSGPENEALDRHPAHAQALDLQERTYSYPGSSDGSHGDNGYIPIYRGEKRPDFVVKADEDSFIMIGELERRLRVLPRQHTYWGYLIRNVFMAGECYGLSYDLVDWIARSPTLLSYTRGKEDKLVARWMRMHPEREKIVWASERCSIYDHPKSGTVYAHGFLFPSEVAEVRRENISNLPPADLTIRGGLSEASAYSSVSRFKAIYHPPHTAMSAAQEVEALIEGSELSSRARKVASLPAEEGMDKGADGRRQMSLDEISDLFARRPSRLQRFNGDGKERGGTTIVHFIKRHDWFLETALALLGAPGDTDG